MRLVLAVVPPMSNVIRFLKPSAAPTRPAAITPPTGPDSIIATGSFFAVAGDITPPFDCMIRNLPSKSSARRRSSILPTYALVSGPM